MIRPRYSSTEAFVIGGPLVPAAVGAGALGGRRAAAMLIDEAERERPPWPPLPSDGARLVMLDALERARLSGYGFGWP